MRESLVSLLMEKELLDAFIKKDAQKCPGEDGLSWAFFLTFRKQVHQPLLVAFDLIFTTDKMPNSLQQDLFVSFPDPPVVTHNDSSYHPK